MTGDAEHTESVTQAVEPKIGPGRALREARERRGLTQDEVAKALRLDVALIGALEADDYSQQPAPAFIRGYLRNYARLLNIPAEPVIAAYNGLGFAQPPIRSSLLHRYRLSSSDRYVSWLSGLVILGFVVFAAVRWQVEHVPGPAELPAEDVAAVEQIAEPPVQVNVEPAAPPISEPVAGGEDVLELRADQRSWVEVTDARGEQLYYGFLSSGESRIIYGLAPFKVLLGYAAGVTLLRNGEVFDHRRFHRGDVATFVVEPSIRKTE